MFTRTRGPIPHGLTFMQEVCLLVGGRGHEIGLPGPERDPSWVPRFLPKVYAECMRLPWDSDPVDMGLSAGFAIARINLSQRCGASTARSLLLPIHADPLEDALTGAHELVHGVGKRHGVATTEADWWMCTAGFVWIASATETGKARYPRWFHRAMPASIMAAF